MKALIFIGGAVGVVAQVFLNSDSICIAGLLVQYVAFYNIYKQLSWRF